MTTTSTLARPGPTPVPTTTDHGDGSPRGHVGRIVTATILGGLLASILVVTVGPFVGAEEHVTTGVVLAIFAASWALLAFLTTRWTDQPQRWANVPAVVMGVAAVFILVVAPTGNEAGWVWPVAILALVAWMVVPVSPEVVLGEVGALLTERQEQS